MADPLSPDQYHEQRKLDAKFAGGVAWTAGAKWATQALTWASTVVVARLLTPADVGISEIAGMYYGVTNVIAEFGMGTAVLYMPDLNRRVLGQLHLFSFLLCSGIFVLSVLASPLLAAFFHSEHILFFAVTMLAFLITGMQAVPIGLLQRDMDYRRLSIAEASMAVTQATVTVVLAFLGCKYWSLSIGGTAAKLVGAILMCYWKPVPFIWPKWSEIRNPIEMGRHVAIGRVTSYACSLSDSIVVGRLLGESALGSYRMAMNLASAPAEKITMLIMRAASPLFANVMDNRPLVRRYYLIIAEVLSLSVMPLMLGLVMVAPLAVPAVLGAKWISATVPLQWLGLFMIMRVLGNLAEQVLISQRLTRFTMRMAIFNFVVMLAAFITAARWKGPDGVAAAWITLSPLTVLPLLIILLRSIQMPFRDYASALLPAVTGSAVMCLALFGLNRELASAPWPSQVRLAVEVAAGGAVYAGFILCFFRARVWRYVNYLSNFRKGKQIAVPAV